MIISTKHIILFLIACCFALELSAQSKEHEAYLIPRNSNNGTVELKWLTTKVLYEEGYNLYRSTGEQGWQKLNSTPYVKPSELPTSIYENDTLAEPIFKMIDQESSIEAFQAGMTRIFVLIRTVMNLEFAKAIGLAYADNNVQQGTNYKYRLTALYKGQEIELADTSIVAGAYTLPVPPTGVSLNRKKRFVELKWDINKLAYYGMMIYRTNLATGNTKLLTEVPVVATEEDLKHQNGGKHPNYKDYDIDKETDYSYELKVMDYYGEIGEGSGPLVAAAKDFDPPLEPFSLKYDQDTFKVHLTWMSVIDDDRYGFNLYKYTDTITNKVKVNDNLIAADTNFYWDVVDEPGEYYYVVAAIDLAGNEAFSGPIIATIRDVIPPQVPTNLKTQTDSGKVILTWTPSPDKDLMGYVVYKVIEGEDVTENDYTLINDVPTKETMYTEKLHKNVKTSFRYVVEAVDTSYNRSEFSDFSIATLPDFLPPVNPVIRNVVLSEDKKSIKIEWEKNADDDIYGYSIYRSEGRDSNATIQELSLAPLLPFETTYNDENIESGKRYVYYLQAIDSARNRSGYSNAFSVTVPGQSASSTLKMKTFSAKLKGKKNVDLKWKVNKPENVEGYVLFRKDGNENLMPLTGNLAQNKFRDKKLKPGVNYQYQLRIYASDGAIIRSEFKEFNIPQNEN